MLTRTKTRLKEFFPAIKHRNFRLFFVGQTLSLIGTYLQQTAEQWLVYAVLTNSKIALGLLSAAQTLPVTFFALYAGVLADQKDKRKILIASQTLMTVLAFIGGYLTYTKQIQFWHVMVLGSLLGLAVAFDWPTRQAFWPDIVGDKKDISSAISLNAAMYNAARSIGPAVAAFAIGAFGIPACYFLNGLSFIAVLIALFLMKTKPQVRLSTQKSVFKHIREGLSYLKHNQEPLLLILLMSVISIFVWSYSTLLPVFAKDILNGDEKIFGVLGVASGIGATLGALLIDKASDKFGKVKSMIISVFSLLLFMLIFAFSRNLFISTMALFISGFNFASFAALDNSLIQLIIPNEVRGRVMSIYVLMFGGTAPFGSLFITYLANIIGTPWALGLGLILAFIALLTFIFRYQLIKKVETKLVAVKAY